MYLIRKMHFSASHRLFNPEFSDEKNDEVYGLCNNLHGHGHNYEIEVTIKGEPVPDTGMIVDLKILKEIIQREVIDVFDHKHINLDVPCMKDIIPTAENIAAVIWDLLKDKLPNGELYEIKLYETPNNIVVYRGEG